MVLSEKELTEMEKKRRLRERAEEREREEERRGLRPSSPIDLTSDAEEEDDVGEGEVMRGRDPGGEKRDKHWLSSNVHHVRHEQSGQGRPNSPTPEQRYKPQARLQKASKERHNERHTPHLSSPDGEAEEAEEDEEQAEEDDLPGGRRSPSIELEYTSSQERIREGSDFGAFSDVDMLDMRLPESRPRVERRALKQRWNDIQKQLNSTQYKGNKTALHDEIDILKARISALTTEIAVLRDTEKLRVSRATESKKRGREAAISGVHDISDPQKRRKKQKRFKENAVQTRLAPPTLHTEPSEASTQNSQQSQGGQGMSKAARRRRNRRAGMELQPPQLSPQIPREASKESRIKAKKDRNQVSDASSPFGPPLTSAPKDKNAVLGQASKGANVKANENRKQVSEANPQPEQLSTSAKEKNATLTKKRKFESFPWNGREGASTEDANVPATKPSKPEVAPDAKANSRRHGTREISKQASRESDSPIAKEVEVLPEVSKAREKTTTPDGKKLPFLILSNHDSPASPHRCIFPIKSPTGWKPCKWLPGGQAYAEEVLKAHLESLEAGGPSLESPRRSSLVSSQCSSSAEHEPKRRKEDGYLGPGLKPRQESPKVEKSDRLGGLMKLARELDAKSRQTSVDSVNTAWQKDHARLFDNSPSKGSKATSPLPEVKPPTSKDLPAAVTKSVEHIIDDAIGLLPNVVGSGQNEQASRAPALSRKRQAGDEQQHIAASQAKNLPELINLVTESEPEPAGAALAASRKKKQPKPLKRTRSTLSQVANLGSGSEQGASWTSPAISPTEQQLLFPQFRSFVPKALAEAVATDTQNNVRQEASRTSRNHKANDVVGSPHVVPSSTRHSEFPYNRINPVSKTKSPAIKRATEKCDRLTPKPTKAPPKRRLSFTPGGNVKRGVEVRIPAVSHAKLQALPSSQEGVQILQAVSSPKGSTTSSKAKPPANVSSTSVGELEVLPEAQAPVLPAQLPSGSSTNLLETDKQSLKFISTEDDDFNTQAELARAQESFQRDLQSPIKYPTFSPSGQAPHPEFPGGDPAEEVIPLVTPRQALRSNKDPYAGGPHPDSDGQEPLSTQAMVDAMSPFTISTVKKHGTFLHALTRPAAAIFGYIGWGGSSQEPASQPASQKPAAEDPPPVEEESVEAPVKAAPAQESVLEPAIDFGKSGLDMETSDDDADGFAYELSQPSEFVKKRKSGKLDNVLPSEDIEESDFENTLKKQRGVRDDRGRWARVAPQLSQPTPSRMTLRSFSSPQGREEGSGEIGQDGQRLTGLETVIDEAGSFLGTWDVEGEVMKMKETRSGSGAGTGATKSSIRASGRRRSG